MDTIHQTMWLETGFCSAICLSGCGGGYWSTMGFTIGDDPLGPRTVLTEPIIFYLWSAVLGT